MQFLKPFFKKLKKINREVEEHQTALTFAEAGLHEQSKQFLENADQRKGHHNLIVSSHENFFPNDMIDYALDMAKRMDYRIIAVNAAHLSHHTMDPLLISRNDLWVAFKSEAEKNSESFQLKAKEAGIDYIHRTSISDHDHAVSELEKEFGSIDFIISENREESQVRERRARENRLARRLCVYQMA